MKRLDTTQAGGHPFTLDDLGFIQAGYKEAITGLLSAFNDTIDTYIISGCVISYTSGGTIINISDGFICYKGEVCAVQAFGFVWAGLIPGFQPIEAPVTPSPVIYEDLSTKNVHLYKFCLFTDVTGVAESVVLTDVKRIEDVIQKKIDTVGTWKTVPLHASSDADKYTVNYTQPSGTTYTKLRYRRHGNKVQFDGAVSYNTHVEGSIIFTMDGVAPLTNTNRLVACYLAGGGQLVMWITVSKTTGDVSLFTVSGMTVPGAGTEKILDLSGIEFYIA